MIFSGVLHRQDLSGRHTSRMWVRTAPGRADRAGTGEPVQRSQDILHRMPGAITSTVAHTYAAEQAAASHALRVHRCAAMYPSPDTVIRHYDVQPRCVILKQCESRTDEQSAAPPVRRRVGDLARARIAPHGRCPDRLSPSPDEALVGRTRDDNVCPASGCHAPRHRQQQRRRSTTDRGSPGLPRRAKSPAHARAPSHTACHSSDGTQALVARAKRIPARSRNCRRLCIGRPGTPGQRRDSHVMQRSAALM